MKQNQTLLPRRNADRNHAIDSFELETKMRRNKISQQRIADMLKPRVSQKAIGKALSGNLRSLLPKIEISINKILKGK